MDNLKLLKLRVSGELEELEKDKSLSKGIDKTKK